jgi:mycofactocin precursor
MSEQQLQTPVPDRQVVPPRVDDDAGTADLIEEDVLVEDVSIDGMCGVY